MSRNRFCKYMKFNRSNLYYKPKGESGLNLRIMEIMDEYYLDYPTTGVKTMTMVLREKDYTVNEKRVRRLMRKMNFMAIYPRKRLSKGGSAGHIHPCLLRKLEINRRNQVWSTDISCIRMIGGFMYLYAIIDVYSRYIVGWKLSNTLSADNVYGMLKESIRKFGAPEIINSDQCSQYTTKAWEDLLKENGILISMDGRGRCKDNIRIERFWRTVKQECVYINPTDSVVELRQGISDYRVLQLRTPPSERRRSPSGPKLRINRIKIWTIMEKELIFWWKNKNLDLSRSGQRGGVGLRRFSLCSENF